MTAAPLIVGVETSSRLVGIALLRHGQLLSTTDRMTPHPRADDLHHWVEEMLAEARVTLEDVTGLAVSMGPGSFTGLRIGVSFVKGLAIGTRLPVVGVPTLDAIAQNVWGARGTVVVLLDAKQGKVYAASYRGQGTACRRLRGPVLGTITSLRAVWQQGTLFVGDGAELYGALLRRRLQRKLVIAPQELWWPRAATIARLGAQQLARGRHADPQRLTPLYLYPSDCTIKKENAESKRLGDSISA